MRNARLRRRFDLPESVSNDIPECRNAESSPTPCEISRPASAFEAQQLRPRRGYRVSSKASLQKPVRQDAEVLNASRRELSHAARRYPATRMERDAKANEVLCC